MGGTGPLAKKRRQAWTFLGFLIFSVRSDTGQASVQHSAFLLRRSKLPPCPGHMNGRSEKECSLLFQPPWLREEWQPSLETACPYQDARSCKLWDEMGKHELGKCSRIPLSLPQGFPLFSDPALERERQGACVFAEEASRSALPHKAQGKGPF